MDNNVIITTSILEDVFELEGNLREEDVAECQASGYTPREALLQGYIFGDICLSAKTNDGKVIGMFGVSNYKQPEGVGIVWYLGNDETLKHPIKLVKGGREYTRQWLEKYKILTNAVDARNVVHIKWLQHIGFTFTVPLTINGYTFLQFYMKRG